MHHTQTQTYVITHKSEHTHTPPNAGVVVVEPNAGAGVDPNSEVPMGAKRCIVCIVVCVLLCVVCVCPTVPHAHAHTHTQMHVITIVCASPVLAPKGADVPAGFAPKAPPKPLNGALAAVAGGGEAAAPNGLEAPVCVSLRRLCK